MFLRFLQRFWAPKKIYFDYASLTPTDKGVLSRMVSVYKKYQANPSSLYARGVKSQKKLEKARVSVARILSGTSSTSVHSDEIFFTGGGTEADNMAIFGVIQAWKKVNPYLVPHVITSEIEHPAVKKSIQHLVDTGVVTATYIPVDISGVVSISDIKKTLLETKNVVLVSIMYVNNEIGVIQPLREIAGLIRVYKKEQNSGVYPVFHTDACQAPCYLDMQIDKLGVDVLALDGGKIYGPRGVGCLYVKRKIPIEKSTHGGGQEDDLRPGTENLPAIVGFVYALEKVVAEQNAESKRLRIFQDFIYTSLPADAFINGTTDPLLRVPNNVNICIPEKDSEFLVFKADVAGIELSAVTACQNSQEESRSYVVDALHKGCGASSLRISMGRGTTWAHVKKLIRVLHKISL